MPGKRLTKAGLLLEINAFRRKGSEAEQFNPDFKTMKDALRKCRERFSVLYDCPFNCVYEIDFKGRLIDANSAALKLFGYERADMPSINLKSLFEESQIPTALKHPEEVTENLYQKETFECRIRRKDGTYVDIESTASIIRHKGKTRSILGVAREITDCKKAEKEIRGFVGEKEQPVSALYALERHLSDIIESLPIATMAVDKKGKVIAWNHAIKNLTGVEARDMLGKGNYEYAIPFYGERKPILIDMAIHPQLELEESYTRIKRNGDMLFGNACVPGLPDGKTYLSITAFGLRNPYGKIVAAIACIRDDTEYEEAREALRHAETEYRSLLENTQEGVFQTTPEGQFITANNAMQQILGYDSLRELISTVTDISRQIYVNQEEREALKQMIYECGQVKGVETQIYRKDGRKIWISMNIKSIRDEKGKIQYYEGTIEDITIIKQSKEERKVLVQKLRKALEATAQAIITLVEARDPYTAGHQRRTSALACAIAAEMELSKDQIEAIRMAGAIHDIGKISVPAEILSKPAKLTDIEFGLIKLHPQAGYDVLKDIDFPWPIARIVLEHHEKVNGSGYPNGLTGNDLLVESKILALADVVEAMTSHRPYRPALGIDAALEEITRNRDIFYDSEIVNVCVKLFNENRYEFEASGLMDDPLIKRA